MADGDRDGCHWALLFADLEKCKCYYGDSLGWPLPTNLEEVVRPNFNKITHSEAINLHVATTQLHWNDYMVLQLHVSCGRIMKEIVDIGILSEDRFHANVQDGTSAAFKTHENDN